MTVFKYLIKLRLLKKCYLFFTCNLQNPFLDGPDGTEGSSFIDVIAVGCLELAAFFLAFFR